MTPNERLAALSRALRGTLPKGVIFNLEQWVAPAEYIARKGETTVETECGTCVCAFGLAAMLPEFQAEGLSLVPGVRVLPGDITYKVGRKRYFGRVALVRFFDLNGEEPDVFFLEEGWPDHYEDGVSPTAIEVADAIDALLAKRGKSA